MAIYYVSPYGSDSNTGLGPDPTSATSKPFATISKALSSAGAAAGDTVYVAPGVYRCASAITPSISGTSALPITVAGDPGNAQGFKDSSGNLLSPGEVRVTNCTTNDTTLPTFPTILTLSGRSWINFSNFLWIGGTTGAGGVLVYQSGSHDCSFTNCMFMHGTGSSSGQNTLYMVNSTSQLPLNLTFDRCIVYPNGTTAFSISLNKNATADYSSGVTIQNSLILGGYFHVLAASTGSGSFLGGGITIKNSTLLFSSYITVIANDSGISSTYPITVYNCYIKGSNTSLFANTSGQIIEDYNIYTGYSSLTPGSHSKTDSSISPLLDLGQWSLWGQNPRPFATPTVASPLLGFGTSSASTTYDFLGRNRPEGGLSLSNAVGYLERHDTAVQETVTNQSGGVGIRIGGPGSHEFQIPVDATATTISVMCNSDVNYGTTTPPQAILLATPEIGVASQTLTAPAVSGQWSTLTFATITPTARGVVRVLLVSRPAAANGNAYFDTFAIS